MRAMSRWLGLGLCIGLTLTVPVAMAQPAPGSDGAPRKHLVCWTDATGQRACGDAVPPRYAGREQTVLDGAGRTIRVIPKALTAEQRLARDTQAREAAQARRTDAAQAAYDRALLATYTTPQELAALRDDRLANLDTRIRLADTAAARDSESLRQLRGLASGRENPAANAAEIERFEASHASNLQAATDLRRGRETLCSTFDRDIRRFQDLKGEHRGAYFSSPCPAPDSVADASDDDAHLRSARSFFEHLAELERDFDPSRFTYYADTAVIRHAQLDAKGHVRWVSVPVDAQIAKSREDLAAAKASVQTFRYAGVKLESELEGRIRVSGMRMPRSGGLAVPFEMVLKPSGRSWLIVEEAM